MKPVTKRQRRKASRTQHDELTRLGVPKSKDGNRLGLLARKKRKNQTG